MGRDRRPDHGRPLAIERGFDPHVLRNTDRPIVAKFTGDRRIVTFARDGRVREWFCDFCGTLNELIHTAEARLSATGRTFTRGERTQYLSN